MTLTLAELARRIGAELRGDGTFVVRGVGSLGSAGAQDVAFVAGARHLARLEKTRAGAVILAAEHEARFAGNRLLSPNPHVAFARAAAMLHPAARFEPGVHPTAVVDPGADVAASASIGPLAVVGAGARISANCQVGPACQVHANAVIGEDTRLVANVFVGERCVLGRRCIVHPGAVIGADGFGYAKDGVRWIKVPQLGRVVIGDDVEIGANTTVDRGALDDTVIENGVKLDNLIQVAHNVRIGEHTAMAAQAGLAGSAIVGACCTVGGQAGIGGHLEIADDVHIMAQALVSSSIREPGVYSASIKASPVEAWRRNAARLGQLDDMARRLKKLEQRIDTLKQESDS
jgi:UDP-3-O-[3-hydroxymyristoyl] glucosamine N-acyltransferase